MTKKLFLILSLLLTLTSQAFSADKLLDSVVAVVGQDVVTRSELLHHARELYQKLAGGNPSQMPSKADLVNEALNSLITQKLELQEAKRLGIGADQSTVAEAINSIAKQNQMTVPQLQQAIQSQGLNFSQFQDNIRNQLIVRRLINREVTDHIQISKSEVDQEMAKMAARARKEREVELQHILIPVAENASPAKIKAAKAEADRIREELDKGAKFAPLAKKYSTGPHAKDGGNTGWLKLSNLPKEFAALIESMHAGEVQGPFRGAEGYHIIKVAAFRDNADQPHMVLQVHARHILIRTNAVTSDADAKRRLERLRQRALDGESFATLARANSDDQASAIKGGDLGWVSPGQMVPEFQAAMDKTPINGISQPFKTRFGWHIVQVLGRREFDASAEARRIAARKAVLQRKLAQAEQEYLQRLRGETYIKILPQGAQ